MSRLDENGPGFLVASSNEGWHGARMPLPSYKEIVELVKKGLTVEAQEKIMELREGALASQEETIKLREELASLKSQLNLQKSFRHERALYWRDGDTVPFCPLCKENMQKHVHLFGPRPMHDPQYQTWGCHLCDTDFVAKEGESFSVSQFVRGRRAK